MIKVSNSCGGDSQSTNIVPAGLHAIRPHEWLQAALPGLDAFICRLKESSGPRPLDLRTEDARKLALSMSEELWEKTTGARPSESHFTLIFPVHDEEACLPSVLDSFKSVHLPSTVSAQIVFVTNACCDRSTQIVKDFLSQIGQVQSFNASCLTDFSVKTASIVTHGNLKFLHVDTARAGKCFALNIGNRLAHSLGHRIVMSVDANNWLEPDSLSIFFADCRRCFFTAGSNIVALDGRPKVVMRAGGGIYARLQKLRTKNGVPLCTDSQLCGWMMAWDSQWLEKAGGIPEVVLEDYSIALKAIRDGRSLGRSTAAIWGYMPNSFSDHMRTLLRIARGTIQLKEYFSESPEILAALASDRMLAKDLSGRLKGLFSASVRRPHKLPFYLCRALVREWALWRARRQLLDDPHSPGWDPIVSTKGV